MVECNVCGAVLTSSKGRIHPILDRFVAECGAPDCHEGLSRRADRAFGPLPSLAADPAPSDHGPLPGALPPSPFASLSE